MEYGFSGGPSLASHAFAAMKTIDAETFARTMLEGEGMGDPPYHGSWADHFQTMFVDVFGDGQVELEDDPAAP